MNDNWFVSDTHFGHTNLITIQPRPWAKDAQEMDNILIERWNDVIHPSDQVYHLGDVSFRNANETAVILSKLKGNIHLVPGNHDHVTRKKPVTVARFAAIHPPCGGR